MDLRARGLICIITAILGIVVVIVDVVVGDDGFTVWNGIAVACFVVVFVYGVSYFTVRRQLR